MVDPGSYDSQAVFLAPTARDSCSQRHDAIRRETPDKPHSRPVEIVPWDSFPRQPRRKPYAESLGSAKAQPNITKLEQLMRQLRLQSAIAQLKNEGKSFDGTRKRSIKLMLTTLPRA